jgi:hypothetical protein
MTTVPNLDEDRRSSDDRFHLPFDASVDVTAVMWSTT